MNFNSNQSIFIQIAERICDRILSKEYPADTRIPSVREIAVEMEVNPNTAMRSFERLQANGIIYNKRGIGNFVSSDAGERIRKMRHEHFISEVLPAVFAEMQLLDIGFDELANAYTSFYQPHKKRIMKKSNLLFLYLMVALYIFPFIIWGVKESTCKNQAYTGIYKEQAFIDIEILSSNRKTSI